MVASVVSVDEDLTPTDTPSRPAPLQAVGMLVAITIAVFGYAALSSGLGITTIHGGFLFLFYWAGMRLAAARELLPSLLGAVGGIGLAYLVMALPVQLGPTVGYAVIAALVLGCIFLMIRAQVPLLINNAFMLYLTVFTFPSRVLPFDFVQGAASVLVAGALAALLLFGAKRLKARGRRA